MTPLVECRGRDGAALVPLCAVRRLLFGGRNVAEPKRPSPDWVYVASSNVEAIRYVGEDWLDVKFKAKGKSPGATYRYYNVPVTVYHEMISAPSKGKFVHERLKGKYTYAKL